MRGGRLQISLTLAIPMGEADSAAAGAMFTELSCSVPVKETSVGIDAVGSDQVLYVNVVAIDSTVNEDLFCRRCTIASSPP